MVGCCHDQYGLVLVGLFASEHTAVIVGMVTAGGLILAVLLFCVIMLLIVA